jgi:hypothetical protein
MTSRIRFSSGASVAPLTKRRRPARGCNSAGRVRFEIEEGAQDAIHNGRSYQQRFRTASKS